MRRTANRPLGAELAAGFTLLAILVVTGAMFILAVAVLLVAGLERGTARLAVDLQRAELAARAGVEDIRSVLTLEAGNDDFVILQSGLASPGGSGRGPAAPLFLVRGRVDGGHCVFRYVPLFSAVSTPADNAQLAPPAMDSLLGANAAEWIDFRTHPYQENVRASWRPLRDEAGHVVARYAYWLEDLQGCIDPRWVGNLAGGELGHARAAYPFPAPGMNPAVLTDDDLPLDQVALFAIEPATTAVNQGTLGATLIRNRPRLLTPGSILAAAHISPPLARDPASGRLIDLTARAAEENLVCGVQPYLERPCIPWGPALAVGVAGTPRLNLNALLAKPPADAVNAMAGLIREALPDFERRKGGFPEDYLKTLAANAIDYADADSTPTLAGGEYRGLDVYPLVSEIALQVNYLGLSNQAGRKIMTFRFKLFAELCNPNNKTAAGEVRLSYEVALPMDGIGGGVGGEPFDAPALMDHPQVSTHDLSLIDGRYWSRPVGVSLQPNQYRCYLFADVTYRMDVGASSDIIPDTTPFSLNEAQGASGVSLMWNGAVVERNAGILRQQGLIYSTKNGITTGGFKVGKADTLTKAALPGHVYDDYPRMYYNMGDPRSSHYLRSAQLDENAYPENSSPNRRNIRLDIYQDDAPAKPKVYARVLPSEWPDGGHNAGVGSWSPGSNDKTEMTDAKFDLPYDPQMGLAAPQFISNAGRFHSVTELGRVFDPIMHAPAFAASDETESFRKTGKLPAFQAAWPDVATSVPSGFYGGGNTLRIGRPEHAAFDQPGNPGLHAAMLLDLFHVGLSRSDKAAEREGPLVRIRGHVNLNTASRDTLRALAAGTLVMDPLLARRSSDDHLAAPTMAPPTAALSLSAPTSAVEADVIADAILRGRPFGSTAGLALVKDASGASVFGRRASYPEDRRIEWTDAAAEEVFARVYEGATVRSRNFRVWIVAQALTSSSDHGAVPEVLAEVRKVYTLFADPGERAGDGSINPGKSKTTITSANDF